ncbi:MAG: aminopeptidase [Betaproteobacteria bacterium]|nr:MAG: aminopeptidase [Betaproteobacteria bacterium]
MDSHPNSALLHGTSRRSLRAAAALLLLPLLAGCTAAGYYWQGIRGQLDLLERARPIPAVLASTEDPALKRKLERVLAIREYASRELALPDNPSYRSYTDLGRRFVLWNVFAAPELSLEPRQWCFPVAGCVNYRGYFDEAAARAEASQLGASGDDVYVGGVPAYSTLGYFNDPMLSTVLRYPDTEVARLIFHELAHQVAYAKDDTVFNESFAVAVEEEGIGRWLAAQDDAALTAQFNTSQRYRDGFRTLVSRTRSELVTLYASPASVEEKRAGKAAAFASMRTAYDALKKEWGGFAAYDGWFAQGPNNANLAAVGLYTQKVPEFHALLAGDSGDLRRFYADVKALAALPKGERDSALAAAAAASRTAGTVPTRAQGAAPPG